MEAIILTDCRFLECVQNRNFSLPTLSSDCQTRFKTTWIMDAPAFQAFVCHWLPHILIMKTARNVNDCWTNHKLLISRLKISIYLNLSIQSVQKEVQHLKASGQSCWTCCCRIPRYHQRKPILESNQHHQKRRWRMDHTKTFTELAAKKDHRHRPSAIQRYLASNIKLESSLPWRQESSRTIGARKKQRIHETNCMDQFDPQQEHWEQPVTVESSCTDSQNIFKHWRELNFWNSLGQKFHDYRRHSSKCSSTPTSTLPLDVKEMRQWKSPASDNIPLELIQSGGLPSKTELILGNADDCHDALWPKHSDLKYTQKTTINMHCKILYIFDLIL